MMRRLVFAVACMIVAQSSSAAALDISVHDRNGVVARDTVIYAVPVDGAPLPAAIPGTATIAQENRQFTPYVSAVTVGTSIRFPNNDKIEHHVKSFSPAKEFELKVYDKGTPAPVVFDKPGIVVVYCLLHGWMRSYVLVLETPYFSKTDADGAARLEDLPAGSYEISAWHPDMGTVKKPLKQIVKIGDKGNEIVRFNLDFVPRAVKAAK